MLQCRHDEHHEQCCDLWKDSVEKASFEGVLVLQLFSSIMGNVINTEYISGWMSRYRRTIFDAMSDCQIFRHCSLSLLLRQFIQSS